ncbi:MAG: DUF1007 family protein [Allorhizobium sp.]
MKSRRGRFTIMLLMLVSSAGQALSHPDVSATARMEFRMDGSRLIGLTQNLVFDDATSGRLASRFDKDRDGRLSEAERGALIEETGGRLADRQFFVEVILANRHFPLPRASSISADLLEGRVVISGAFALPDLPDVRGQTLSLVIRDPDLTIAFRFDPGRPAELVDASPGCRVDVRSDPAMAYFGGLVTPEALTLSCP